MEKRVAWVTGGIKGLGVSVAKALAADGYRIVVNYRTSKEAAQRLTEELTLSGSEVLALPGDVGKPRDVKQMVKNIGDRWGRLDVLVCTAGPFLFNRISTLDTTDQQWKEMVEGNLSGVFYCSREVIPFMRQQRFGRIITFGFAGAEYAPAWPGYSAYAAAKAGVVAFTRTLAVEEASYGISVNMVVPGDIRHPFKEAMIYEAEGAVDRRNPVGRPGTGEDIARVIRFLVDPDSDFITGAVIPVTGGYDLRTSM